MQAAYGDLEVSWRDVHRIVLATHDPTFQQPPIPVSDARQSGADDPFGPLRVLFRYPETDMKHFFAVSGDGYVQLVEFAKDGAKAQALLGYGNSSRPGSPPFHVIDQLPYFEAKTLRSV
jgi:acyl-homoserine-lactone acylase